MQIIYVTSDSPQEVWNSSRHKLPAQPEVTPGGKSIHLACPRMITPLQLLTSSPLVIPKRSAMLSLAYIPVS